MAEPGQGCGCPLCRADPPVYGSLTVAESEQRQARYAQLRRTRFVPLEEDPAVAAMRVKPLPAPPAKAGPNWRLLSGFLLCAVIWGLVLWMVFHG